MLDDEPEPTASEFVDFTFYGEVIPAGLERPPLDVEEPRLWTLTDDTARALADKRTQSAYDEYLHIGCYAFFDSCANAAIGEGLDALSNDPPLSTEQTAAVALIRAGHCTHTSTEEAARTRLGFLRLTKGGHASTDADRVFAELAHERFCRPRPTAVSGPLDALRQAFVDRTLEVSLLLNSELPRFEACGAWERSDNPRYVSRMLLVPKPGHNQWHLIIDLRELNRYCSTFNMTCETLKHLRHLSRPGDYFVSMDLTDGYYTLGIREEDRDYFTVNYRGTMWRRACLPMGGTGSVYYFCKLTHGFTNYRRRPSPPTPAATHVHARPSKRFLWNARWRGTRLLPCMDDFIFLAASYHDALVLRERIEALLDRLGLQRNPKKGIWTPTQVGDHLGLTVDLQLGMFHSPPSKLHQLAQHASSLLGRAASNARRLPTRQLAAFAGKAQFLYLAIAPHASFCANYTTCWPHALAGGDASDSLTNFDATSSGGARCPTKTTGGLSTSPSRPPISTPTPSTTVGEPS
jgi:hypothetical protein